MKFRNLDRFIFKQIDHYIKRGYDPNDTHCISVEINNMQTGYATEFQNANFFILRGTIRIRNFQYSFSLCKRQGRIVYHLSYKRYFEHYYIDVQLTFRFGILRQVSRFYVTTAGLRMARIFNYRLSPTLRGTRNIYNVILTTMSEGRYKTNETTEKTYQSKGYKLPDIVLELSKGIFDKVQG